MQRMKAMLILFVSLVMCLSACSSGTKGLEYTINSDENSYSCTGIGDAEEGDIVIRSAYRGRPVTEIGENAFMFSGITSIVIPEGVETIHPMAFFQCEKLTSVEIPSSVKVIGNSAFFNCGKLAEISIPDGVVEIDDSAFSCCDSITNIVIPDSVSSIGDAAFQISGLTSIIIPDSVTYMGKHVFSYNHDIVIYCEAEERPSGWDEEWNYRTGTVVWGYTAE